MKLKWDDSLRLCICTRSKNGVTLAIFNFKRNTPFCIHLLYMLAKIDEVYSASILINLMEIFLIPTDFFPFRCIISQKSSPSVQGSQKKEFGDDEIVFGVSV